MKNANQDIRYTAKDKGIKLWQIADRYGITDGNFSRMLRKELPPEKKERIFAIIEEIQTENAVKGANNYEI